MDVKQAKGSFIFLGIWPNIRWVFPFNILISFEILLKDKLFAKIGNCPNIFESSLLASFQINCLPPKFIRHKWQCYYTIYTKQNYIHRLTETWASLIVYASIYDMLDEEKSTLKYLINYHISYLSNWQSWDEQCGWVPVWAVVYRDNLTHIWWSTPCVSGRSCLHVSIYNGPTCCFVLFPICQSVSGRSSFM